MPASGNAAVQPPAGRAARLRALAGRLALALSTGVILTYYSEWAFWARPLQGILPADAVPTAIAYSFAAYAFLVTISAFRVRSLEALFLAGAGYGWLVEGVIVQTMVDDFPLNLSWTGLAWHALITISLGWHALPRALRRASFALACAWCGLAGLVYGGWAVWWWVEAPPPTSPAHFAAYVSLMTTVLALAYGLGSRIRLPSFTPGRVEIGLLCAAISVYFALVSLPAQPLTAFVVPPLAAGVLLTLRRNALSESGVDLVRQNLQDGPLAIRRLSALAVLPLTATAVYALAGWLDWRPPTGMLLYAITTPLGFLLLAASVIRIWRRSPALVGGAP